MAVTTQKTFAATSNTTTTTFTPVSIQLNNQDDLDVYVTLSGGTRVLQLRQSTGSTAQSSHPQVSNTDGLYFPAVSAGTTLYNYTLSTDNNTITFNSALPSGAVVSCERRTRDADGTYTSFASGSTIRATDLNNSARESNFTAQEARNKAFDLEGKIYNNVANANLVIKTTDTGTVSSSMITDGTIVNADINASADIAGSKLLDDSVTLDKLGSGALPTDITIASANIVNGTIVDADIATGTLDNRYFTETELTSGGLIDSRYYTETELNAGQLDNRYYTETELNAGQLDNRYYTETELNAGQLDNRYYTETEAEALFLRQDSSETIASGDTWSNTDSKVATTAAINARIVDLVDDVGGFTVIANETSFPNTNPQGTTRQAAIMSIGALSQAYTPTGTTVTIANGTVGNSTVTVTGVPSALPQGFGILVESTSTLNTYTFHRLVPKATEVTTVASNVTNISAAGANVTNINSAVSNASNINTVAGSISNVNTVSGSIASVNSAASNLSSINTFGDQYQVASSPPSTDGGGNSLAVGDLFFDSTASQLKVYNGTAWQGGVTASGSFAATTGNTFTGSNVYNDNAKAVFGTNADGLEVFHNGNNSIINDSGTGNLLIQNAGNTKGEFNTSGLSITGNIAVSGTVDGRDVATDGTKLDGISSSAIANVVQDTSPQLGGNLDVQSSKITTATTNGNVQIEPNGTGVVEIRGAGGTDGTLQLNCSAQSHGVKIKSPAHSAAASYTLTLPVDIQANKILTTDANGQTSWTNSAANLTSIPAANITGTLPAIDGSNLTGIASAEVYGFEGIANGTLQLTTTGGGSDNISGTAYAGFEDVFFAASGFSFSINTDGKLIATI